MAHLNYMKVKNGAFQGLWRRADDAPEEEGVIWLPFDTNRICPQCVKIENGRIVQDDVKHQAHLADQQLQADRESSLTSLRQSAVNKTWDVMSTAERKAVVGLMPTDAEMGLG